MLPAVAAFTDTYHPTVNGITYALDGWRDRWRSRGGRMAVVYPDADYEPRADEHPVPSLPFPFYEGFRIGLPLLPDLTASVTNSGADRDPPDIVHAHTPTGVGLAGLRSARRTDRPLVATYHTPLPEYASYLPGSPIVARIAAAYERWFYRRADLVTAPSATALDRVPSVDAPTAVVPNGIDLERFVPVDRATARDRLRDRGYEIPDGPLVGYTGRHGHEKRIGDLIDAAAGRDGGLLIGGDGPARDALEERAADAAVDASFLGFLPREDLPTFYAALDVFGFPSPVETQGVVAMEAMACGTPVVGCDAGALRDTISDGSTGLRYPPGDVTALGELIDRVIADRDAFADACLDRRDEWGLERATDALAAAYRRVLDS